MAQYAVVLVGSHQYRVEKDDIFEIEKMDSIADGDTQGQETKLDQVLLVQQNGKSKLGQPFVPKASVTCEVLGEVRLPKTISFKFKRRKGYKRKKGHRQTVVRLRVKSIQAE